MNFLMAAESVVAAVEVAAGLSFQTTLKGDEATVCLEDLTAFVLLGVGASQGTLQVLVTFVDAVTSVGVLETFVEITAGKVLDTEDYYLIVW